MMPKPTVRRLGGFATLPCFPSAAACLTHDLGALTEPLVRCYCDSNSTGPSFEAYLYEPDLAATGWDNLISSFTPLNGGHTLWWTSPNRSGNRWDWGTASVATLGAANDQISSTDKG
jgi:hypothetical protein